MMVLLFVAFTSVLNTKAEEIIGQGHVNYDVTSLRIRKAPVSGDVITMVDGGFKFDIYEEEMVVGENYKFGCKQGGDYQLLKKMGEERGVKVVNVPSVLFEDERVSSSRIRRCLLNKDLEMANRMLTVPYFILGEVAQGKKLGRTLGFPTINIDAHPLKLFPPNGVYATRTLYNGQMYYGVTNVGKNPTVNGTFKVVETYLFDFHQMIYGETLQTYFFKWIRSEQKFPSVEDLRQQLERDANSARAYFATQEYDFWRENY